MSLGQLVRAPPAIHNLERTGQVTSLGGTLMHRSLAVALAIGLSLCATNARADLLISLGNIQLQPNQPNQSVPVFVHAQGGELVQGLILRVQLGAYDELTGTFENTPLLTGDILAPGALFEHNNTG